jgi:hypothetical protein
MREGELIGNRNICYRKDLELCINSAYTLSKIVKYYPLAKSSDVQ